MESTVELKLLQNDLSWIPFKKTKLVEDHLHHDEDDLAAAINDLEKLVDAAVGETK